MKIRSLVRVYKIHKGWSCEQIFDSSTTFLNPLVGTNSLYGKRTVGFFLSPHTPVGRVRLARFACVRLLHHALPISLLILINNRLFCSLVFNLEKVTFFHFYSTDLVNTKTTTPSGSVNSARYIYLDASRHIHHYSPPLRGIVV